MSEQQTLPLAKPKRKSPENVRRLSPKEVFQLATLVAAEYTSSGKSDADFALYACEKLAIPGINQNHIGTSREIHGIPALRFAKAAEAAAAIPRDSELYSRVLSLEKQVRKLFALGEKAALVPVTDDGLSKFIVEYYGTKAAPEHLIFAKAILREFA